MAHSLSAYFLPSPPPPWTAVATATYGLDPPSPLSPPPARSVYAGTHEPKAAASDEGGGARRRRNLQLYIPYPTLSCHTWLNLKRGLGNDPPPRRRRRRSPSYGGGGGAASFFPLFHCLLPRSSVLPTYFSFVLPFFQVRRDGGGRRRRRRWLPTDV